jgi:2-polyprenyl-6-methoxyphenol hydroxylase-like FAD-dependent oxidoreductase
MIMIRIKENVWRVAGNMKDVLNYLPAKTTFGKITWQSKFNISHNIAHSLVHDNIVLIGDAAHIHSPIGGRGMNLGIEDAYIVSRLIKENRLSEYEKLRKDYLRKTVSRVNNMTQFVAGHSAFSRFARNMMGMFKPFYPLVKSQARNFALGLDKNKMR